MTTCTRPAACSSTPPTTPALDVAGVEQLASGGASLISGATTAVERMRTWDEIGTANKKSSTHDEANAGEAGIGMRRRAPHEEPGGPSVAPPADGSRYPLAPLKGGETPYGAEGASRGSNTSLRPYVVPYTNRSAPAAPAVKPAAAVKQLAPDDNGVTLRYDTCDT